MAVNFPKKIRDGAKQSWEFNRYGNIEATSRSEFSYGANNNLTVYSDASLEVGGRQIALEPYGFGDLKQSRKVYVSEKESFVRYLEIFTNEGTTATSTSFTISSNLTESSPDRIRTSDGDDAFNTGDDWIVWDSTTGSERAVAHVVAGDHLDGPSAVTTSYRTVSYTYDVELAPGETKVFMHFVALGKNASKAADTAKKLAALKFDALHGLSDDELDNMANFAAGEDVILTYNGTGRDDVLVGDRYDETFEARDGNDLVFGDAGDDRIDGGQGNDQLLGANGDDLIAGGYGKDLISGGNGDDRLHGDNQNDLVTTAATKTIRTSGEKISVSMTVPDAANGTSLPLTGFVARTPITSSEFNVAFVIDTSSSTSSQFNGKVNVGDKNGDGSTNQIIDAEIAGFEALLKGLTKQISADKVNVGVISFNSGATTVFEGNAAIDSNADGRSNVVDALRSLDSAGSTYYDSGLQEAVRFFQNSGDGQNLVFFLSDGYHNGGEFDDEVSVLLRKSGIDATIRSFGVGSGASEAQLDLVDDRRDNDTVDIVLDPSDLSKVLIDPGIDRSDVARVEILVNGKVVKTISGKALDKTPLGLSFSFETTLKGLRPTKADEVSARVIASDPDKTRVITQQTVEVLKGEAGRDSILGGDGDDFIFGDGGNDLLYGNDGVDQILGGAGNDTLLGGRRSDNLDGGSGNDDLNGGLSGDVMAGGSGDDTYHVDSKSDRVVETGGEGKDTILAKVDNISLGKNVEKLVLAGKVSSGKGNDSKNTLVGNAEDNKLDGKGGADMLKGEAGKDSLVGGAGDDTLAGGRHADVLTGGGGEDHFRFDSLDGKVDKVRDLNLLQDVIELDHTVFKGLGKSGKLDGAALNFGSKASDKSDHILYDKKTGILAYDPDGKGGKDAIKFADVDERLDLHASDFLIV